MQDEPVLRKRCRMAPIGLCLLMGFTMVHFFAQGTSLLRRDSYCWDSGLFQTIGMLWAEGLVPYKQAFDHKGPLLFLIQRIAYAFADPQLVLFLLESLFVSAALYLCYQTIRLRTAAVPAMAGTALCALFWLPVLEYGNLSEEYSLPFVLLALYVQLRWMRREQPEHPWQGALVYGLCFGATLMIRPNNGALIAAVTGVITIALALRGQWKNILVNAVALLAGVLLAVLPFVAYFAAKGALGWFLSMVMALVTLLLNRAWGPQPALLLVTLALGALMAAAIGILGGAFIRDANMLMTVVKGGGIFLYAPGLIYMFPEIPQWIARIFPTYYLIQPVIEITQEGGGLASVAPELAVLVILTAILLALIAVVVRRAPATEGALNPA